MKQIKKYWPYVYAVLIVIYEVQAELIGNEFIPTWVKTVVGLLAAVGLVLKNMPNEKPS